MTDEKSADPINYVYENGKLKREIMEMGRRAASEIRDLRAAIDRLTPKAHAYDNLTIVLGLLPQPSRAYGEDLAYRIDKRADEMDAEINSKKETE